ncbi:1-phosphatidylinositol 4,5-bisphosphate phosphodiesterase delta-1a isoform X2 [Heterodontus francisci]|uniref:1-phosphatidylinositol 4,5-bisphosphate phosphodiesterase delta-1a isoform X2 n=1 Tax=Heterodontus francisci TaxID=7792 RepID=UPI00355B2B79
MQGCNGVDNGFVNDEDLKALLKGSHLQKIKSSSWMKSRFYKLLDDCRTVWYDSQKILKSARAQIFSIDDIQEVRSGHQSEGMQRYAMEFPADRCFTIVFKGRKKNLDLIASDEKEANHWINGLNKLKKRDSKMNKRERLDQWFQIYLQKADADKDNKMTLDEVKKFLHMMNIEVDDLYARDLFTKCDKSNDGTIHGKEIEQFYKLVTEREEITTIFEAYCDQDRVVTVEKLTEFLRKEQRENASKEYAAGLIEKYELNEEAKVESLMTKDGFMCYLMSSAGDVFNQEHNKVYQDMTKPLNQYYISSSHNTYLTKDQLEGPSSVEAYISALNKGCRCVELDCWDGRDGEPVIYHGYTLTSKILFKDVIEVIKQYAFKASPYPVILSLENHCSIEQQIIMAKHMKDILGDMLLTKTIDGKVPINFPSPEQLKGKILIKGKRLNRLEDEQGVDVNDEVSDEDEAAEGEDDEEKKEKKEAGGKIKLAKELSDLVIYCKSVHFHGFEDAMHNQVFYEMSSFVESKFNKLVQESAKPFIQLNARQLSRIYPAGRRTDSSNYNPIDMWNAGCQIVALNFQTPGKEMDINQSKFLDNGFSGYNLKPKYLREKKPTFDPKNIQKGAWLNRKKLHVMVISAQQLPKSNRMKISSIVDPLVTVEVFGVDDNDSKVTETVSNNGFNPMWNTNFQFDISVPELTFVRFLVEDYDLSSRNDFIGQFTLPFTSLKLGYRHIHLQSENGHHLPSASLFVHIMIE